MSKFWEKTYEERKELAKQVVTERVNVGDITVVCHTSNQDHLLQKLINSARRVTDKIVILDDCSKDDTVSVALENGCQVYSIPEGWIYTNGFDGLLKFHQSICNSEYHLQLDAGEHLYVPDDARMLTEKYYRNLLIFEREENGRKTQINNNRLFKTDAPVNFDGVIHSGPKEAGDSSPLSDLIIFHGCTEEQNNKQCYLDRKTRLYFKLLKRGYYEKKLPNMRWYKEYEEKKEEYDKIIAELEEKMGVLEETDKTIEKIN